MNKQIKRTLALISSTCMLSSAHAFFDIDKFFDAQMNMMQEMRENMRTSQKSIQSSFSTSSPITMDIRENDADNMVVIKVKGIKADTIDATLSDDNDLLTVKTANERIKLYIDDRYLSVEISQEMKKETTDEDKKEKKKAGKAVPVTIIDDK